MGGRDSSGETGSNLQYICFSTSAAVELSEIIWRGLRQHPYAKKKKKTQGATQSPKVVSLWHKDPFRPWKKPIFVIYDIRKLA